MADQTEKVLFEVRLDAEQYKQEQKLIRESLEKQTLDIEKTRLAQKALTQARKDQTISDEDFARTSVALAEQLRTQQAEQRELQKGLATSQKAYTAAAGSIDQLKARSAELTQQYNAMSQEQRENTAEGKALTEELLAVNEALKAGGASVGDFRRNVGNYSGSTQDLVKQLVKLREEEKSLLAGSKELADNQRRQAGFMTAAQRAAAQAGQTYDEATTTIENYAKSIQPATAELVKLEQEQARLVESGEEASESFRKIGFQIGKLEKDIKEVPVETKKVSDRLTELDDTTGAFGGRVSSLKESFTAAKGGFDVATKGLSGVRVAMLAVPIFAVIAALAALYAYFTRTQEGADFVERKMKAVSVVMGVLVDKASAVGEWLFDAFDHPQESLEELVDAIETNLLNRLKSFGVLLDGILSGDFTKIADSAVQFATGITDATAKAKALGQELGEAAKQGEAIAAEFQRIRDEERRINVERAQAKKDIEALKLTAEDVTKSTTARAEATRKAFDLEQKSSAAQLKAQRDRVANMQREAALTNQLTEQNDELAEEKIKLAELEEGSLTRQIELNNKLNELHKLGLDQALADAKALAERRVLEAEKGSVAELRARIRVIEADKAAQLAAIGLTVNQRRLIEAKAEDDIRQLRLQYRYATAQEQAALDQLALDKQLKDVQSGSDEELNILQRKLKVAHDLELAQVGLTIGQKKALNEKYEQESLALGLDFARRRLQAALQLVTDTKNAELATAKDGSLDQLQLQRDLIEQQRQQQLAALDVRADNEAKIRLINAQATKAANELEFTDALRRLEQYLTERRTAVNDQYVKGELTQAQHEAALAAIERAGQQARIVTLEDYGRDTTAEQEKQSALNIQALEKEVARKQELHDNEDKLRQQNLSNAQTATDVIIELFGEETAAGQAALALKKTLAVAEIAIGLQKQLAANAETGAKISASAPPISIPLGAAYIIGANALSITAAAASTAKVLALADGGIVEGPGGPKDDQVPARLSRGEGVMTAKAVEMFGPLLSLMNQLGGGVAFRGIRAPNVSLLRLAEGGGPIARYDVGFTHHLEGLRQRGGAPAIDYDRLAHAVASQLPPAQSIDYEALADAVAARQLPPIDINYVEIDQRIAAYKRAENKANM